MIPTSCDFHIESQTKQTLMDLSTSVFIEGFSKINLY